MEYSARARDVKEKRKDERYYNRKKVDSDMFYKGRSYKYGKEDNGDYNGGSKKMDQNFPEESRLQSLVRRVVTVEGDLNKRLSAVETLKQYLATPDNAQSVCLLADEAVCSLRDVFTERINRDMKMEVAACIGNVVFIYTNENRSAKFIDWIFPNNVSEDIRLFYLHSTMHALKLDKTGEVFRGVIQFTLIKCKTILESANSPELLEGIVRVLILISKLYPMFFKKNFRDVVDILVGWHLDDNQKETVIQFISNSLISFQSYWSADVSLTFKLLSEFLEDMELHITNIEVGKKNKEELIIKVASLMRTFTTVIKCLGSSSPVENQYLLEVFERLIMCASKFSNKLHHERTLEYGNYCIRAIVAKLGSMDCPTQNTQLFDFIMEQATSKVTRCRPCTVSLLSLVTKLVDVITTKLPVEFLSTLLGINSIIPRISYLYSKEMSKHLIDFYHSLMVLKSVPLIQGAYKLILCQLEMAYNTLLNSEEIATSDNVTPKRCTLVSGVNSFSSLKYSDSQAEAIIILNVRALVEIGNAKSNLIGMWALSPSLFVLFSGNLSPLNPIIAKYFPLVNYCIIEALCSHCCRHGHFILSSQLLSVSKESSLTSNSGHLSSILTLVRSLLIDPVISTDCRCLTLRWALDIIEQLLPTKSIYSIKSFLQLLYAAIDCGFSPRKDISISACNCLISFFTNSQTYDDLTIRCCIELSSIKVNNNVEEVRNAYLNLLKSLPMSAMQMLSSSLLYDDNEEGMLMSMCKGGAADTFRQAYHNFMSIEDEVEGFNQMNFVNAISFLLDKNILSRREFSSDWLARQYFSCQANKTESSDIKSTKLLASLVHSDSDLQWFWDVWQAAKFCVSYKLKTPLGNKPQDTFLAIENTLKYYAAWPKSITVAAPSRSEGQYRQRMLKVKLLLFFMECLEKNVYNAIEGCAIALPQFPKMVRSFFRTNRSTCREWLSRVRMPVIMVAQETGQWAQVVRQSFELLQDLKDGLLPMTAIDKVLTHAVQALIELKAPNALEGLYKWAVDILPEKDLTWIESAIQMASGGIESSVLALKTCYKAINDSSLNGAPNNGTQILNPCNQPVLELIDREITEGYFKIGSYEEALNWKKSLISQEDAPAYSDTNYSIQQIKNLMCFNLLDFKDFKSQSLGENILKDGDDMRHKIDWRVTSHLKKADEIYMSVIKMLCDERSRGTDMQSVKGWLSKCMTICEDVLCVTTEPNPVCINEEALILFNKSSVLYEQLEGKNLCKIWLSNDENVIKQCSGVSIASQLSIMNQCHIQQNIYNLMHPEKPVDLSNHLSSHRLAAIKHSRCHGNYNLCTKLLLDQIEVISTSSVSHEPESQISTSNVLNSLSCINDLDLFSCPQLIQSKMQIERQAAKLLYEQGETSHAIKTFCSSISYSMEFMRSVTGTPQKILSALCESNARSLVTLVSWLQTDNKLLSYFKQPHRSSDSSSPVAEENFIQHFKNLLDNGSTDAFQWSSGSDTSILSDMDILIKNLLNLSTTQCPLLAKSWFQLANWSYKWGRKAVDHANEESFDLTANEKFLLLQTMPPGYDEEQLDKITKIISQVHKSGENVSEDDIAESNQMRSDDELDLIRRQLLSACPALISHPDKIESMINLWRTVVYRVYHHYKMSALSYFSFLKLNGTNNSDLKIDCNTTATLRLLRLLVKHSWGLRDVLEGGLAQSFTEPWKGIIPQLFSRLNHPEPYVRQSVTDLLCRVAKDTPHLIVYPAVVGYSSGKDLVREDGGKDGEGFWNEYFMKGNTSKGDNPLDMDIADDFMSQDDEGGRDEIKYTTDVNSCFSQILDTLVKVNPRMVGEIQLLVSELHRITLLWDELWVGALGQTCQDLHKRISHLEVEVVKVVENKNLTEEERKVAIFKKHETILKPTIFLMEKLQEVTSQNPDSAHEKWFQESFKERIKSAIDLLKSPINPRIPENSMEVFKQLLEDIQKKSHRYVHQQILEMKNISPALSNLRSTVIAMPGLSSKGELVTINGISNIVQILPTKTKPKKLVFIGSNGVRYPYLFKGLEDLHLDERIMQFLTIVNNMFSSSKSKNETYRARHYSVTPLGARSGLIQWVEGATPMFSLYKKWFQREATAAHLKQVPNGEVPQNVAIPRPSELYYNKLNPLLKEKNISTHQRKDWPVQTLRRVLKELMAETPKDLLSKELWCYSGTALDWWNVSQSYARSTAVMSMIGYVIGLGDRHLDNLLIDLSTGEVVHIDYNVCFEKGKSLRIPEKVPFRLTQNLQHALGLSGIEGTFRLSCEHVMKTMRQGKETLLTLLEAFVYDPLVDWTIGNEWCYTGAFYGGNHPLARSVASKQSRRELEREVTASMFSIKMAENKHEWITNRDDMVHSISKLESVMTEICKLVTEMSTTQQDMEGTERQANYLKEALETWEDHAIYSLQKRFLSMSGFEFAKNELTEYVKKQIKEIQQLDGRHKDAIYKLKSNHLLKLTQGLNDCNVVNPVMTSELVDFLQGAGQGSLVAQAELIYAEFNTAFLGQQLLMQEVISVMLKYCNILEQLPYDALEFKTESYMKKYIILDDNMTLENLQAIEAETEKEISEEAFKAQEAFTMFDNLGKEYVEANKKYDLRVSERLSVSSEDRATLHSKYEMSLASIHKSLEEPSNEVFEAMRSALVFNLCSIAKQILPLELNIYQTGLDAINIASLDYLLAACSQANLLIQLSTSTRVEGEKMMKLYQTSEATSMLLESARDLMFNFSTVIVPEARQSFLTTESTLLELTVNLEMISSEVPSVDFILNKLENNTSRFAQNTQNGDLEILSVVESMKSRFKELFTTDKNGDTNLTNGQMLLTAMDGLFQKLFQDFSKLRGFLISADLPSDVNYLNDVFSQADKIKNMSSDGSEYMSRNLRCLFFMHQYQATLNFFRLCQQSTIDFQHGYQTITHLEPVFTFLSKHVRDNILGLTTQLVIQCINLLLDQLSTDVSLMDCNIDFLGSEVINHCLSNQMTTTDQMQFFHESIFFVCDALRVHDHSRCLDNYVETDRSVAQNKHQQLVALQWLHSNKFSFTDSRQQQQGMNDIEPSSIRSMMTFELKEVLQKLIVHQTEQLEPSKSRLLQVEKTIGQRLKWAAGANMAVASTQQKYEELLDSNDNVVKKLCMVSSNLLFIGGQLHSYEEFSVQSGISEDMSSNFLQFLTKSKKICKSMKEPSIQLSLIEVELMNSDKLETSRKITKEWVKHSLDKLMADEESFGKNMMIIAEDHDKTLDEMKKEVNKVRSVVSIHHRILSDMRTILKTMGKHEEYEHSQSSSPDLSVCAYLEFYVDFSSNFSNLLRDIYSMEVIDVAGCQELLEKFPLIKKKIIRAYNDLMSLAAPLLPKKSNGKGKGDKKDLVEGLKKDDALKAVVCANGVKGVTSQVSRTSSTAPTKPDKIKRDPKTGKAIQERNSFAVGMWRKVKQKLEGKDVEGRGRLNVSEQVDYVIKEALSLDNLAVLYEGWTPWV